MKKNLKFTGSIDSEPAGFIAEVEVELPTAVAESSGRFRTGIGSDPRSSTAAIVNALENLKRKLLEG